MLLDGSCVGLSMGVSKVKSVGEGQIIKSVHKCTYIICMYTNKGIVLFYTEERKETRSPTRLYKVARYCGVSGQWII